MTLEVCARPSLTSANCFSSQVLSVAGCSLEDREFGMVRSSTSTGKTLSGWAQGAALAKSAMVERRGVTRSSVEASIGQVL